MPAQSATRRWLTRLGLAGFIFFTLKGMVWLALAALVWLGLWKL